MKKLTTIFLACFLLANLTLNQTQALEPATKKLKIFILAGQSNMQGHAKNSVFENRYKDKKLKATVAPYFKDGAHLKRSDVFINHIDKKMSGPLSLGYGADKTKVGPELAFGFSMGDKFEEEVLIIKAAWGGKSIHRDFLSPSGKMPSDEFIKAGVKSGKKKKKKKDLTEEKFKASFGHYYREMMKGVNETLKNLKKHAPNYKGQGYEIAGFVWYQGYNDMFSDHAKESYQDNMANFIRDVRKDLKVPALPFVIGALGHNGAGQKGKNKIIADAQIATAEMPEFKGNVVTVKTNAYWDLEAAKLYDEYKANAKKEKRKKKNPDIKAWTAEEKAKWEENWDKTGSNKPYHYFGSATFFIRAGNGFAEAMLKLMK